VISPPSHFALLDIMLDKILDSEKECLITTRQLLYPDLAVQVSSHKWGNRFSSLSRFALLDIILDILLDITRQLLA